MTSKPTDINVYRRRKALRNGDAMTPACFPEPSDRFPSIIFSYPSEGFIVHACKLSQLMDDLALEALMNAHTVVIQDCVRRSSGVIEIKLAVFDGEDPVDCEKTYYDIVEVWNRLYRRFS